MDLRDRLEFALDLVRKERGIFFDILPLIEDGKPCGSCKNCRNIAEITRLGIPEDDIYGWGYDDDDVVCKITVSYAEARLRELDATIKYMEDLIAGNDFDSMARFFYGNRKGDPRVTVEYP